MLLASALGQLQTLRSCRWGCSFLCCFSYCSLRQHSHLHCCSSCWGSLCRPLQQLVQVQGLLGVLLGSQQHWLGWDCLLLEGSLVLQQHQPQHQLHQVAMCSHQFPRQFSTPAPKSSVLVSLACQQGLFGRRRLKWLSGQGGRQGP